MCGRQLDLSLAEEKAVGLRAIRCTACLRMKALAIVQTRKTRLLSRGHVSRRVKSQVNDPGENHSRKEPGIDVLERAYWQALFVGAHLLVCLR